ncbi:MAG: type 4a pilus biogenesis protein PilO [Candidatus Tenebribacter burtonii]|jgi:Tfp pilus assembly protein PilO|nr:type 4a pilus biogenesis protein PilO [Candidatus Tenebribacter burtonii]
MRNKYLALLFVMILSAIIFFYMSSNTIKAKIEIVGRYDEEIKSKQEILNSAKVLNEQLKEVSKVITNSMTTKRYYNASEVNAFVKKIADLADKYKISVNSMSPKVVASSDKNLVQQQYSFLLECTYVQFGQFLTDLESFDQIIEITELDVKPIKTDDIKIEIENPETRYKVTIQLSTFKIIKEV